MAEQGVSLKDYLTHPGFIDLPYEEKLKAVQSASDASPELRGYFKDPFITQQQKEQKIASLTLGYGGIAEAPAEQPSMASQIVDMTKGAVDTFNTAAPYVKGFAMRGPLKTIAGAANIVRKTPQFAGLDRAFPGAYQGLAEAATPQNPQEQMGQNIEQGVEQFAALALPNPITKIKAVASLGPYAKVAADALKEATTAGVLSMAQTGGDTEKSLDNAATTGAFSLGGGLAKQGLGKMGKQFLKYRMMENWQDRAKGFDLENVKKYGLKGGLAEMGEQVQKQIASRAAMRNARISPGVQVNLLDQATALANDLKSQIAEGKFFGVGDEALAEVDKFVEALGKISPNGKVDLRQAENIKEMIGDLAAFYHNPVSPGLRGPIEELGFKEKIYNDLYVRLKTAIERASGSGDEIKRLNKEMSELIPIRQQLIRRIPIDERQAMLNLTDVTALIPAAMKGGGGHLFMSILPRIQRNAKIGNWLWQNADSPSSLVRGLNSILNAQRNEIDVQQ